MKANCLIFKASETREHLRIKYIINKLFSSFSDDFLNNFIIIFTFADSLKDIPAFNILKSNLTFLKIFENIKKFPKFYFNNIAYFNNVIINYDSIYDGGTINFYFFFKIYNRAQTYFFGKF